MDSGIDLMIPLNINFYISLLITSLYFYIPGGSANIAAFFGMRVPLFKKLKTPVDFGLSIKGVRIIGDHKLLGGFLFGVFFGILMGIIKYLVLDNFMGNYVLLSLNFSQSLILSFILAFFAVTGDVLKSIVKRLLNIPPHAPWIPFDEIDHSVTSLVAASVFFPIPIEVALIIIVSSFLIHMFTNFVGFLLKIKSVPY